MRMSGEAKQSEVEATESEISLLVIPVDQSKEEKKVLTLSNALAELIVESKEDKKIKVIVKGSKKDMEKKIVNEGLIPFDVTRKRIDS